MTTFQFKCGRNRKFKVENDDMDNFLLATHQNILIAFSKAFFFWLVYFPSNEKRSMWLVSFFPSCQLSSKIPFNIARLPVQKIHTHPCRQNMSKYAANVVYLHFSFAPHSPIFVLRHTHAIIHMNALINRNIIIRFVFSGWLNWHRKREGLL